MNDGPSQLPFQRSSLGFPQATTGADLPVQLLQASLCSLGLDIKKYKIYILYIIYTLRKTNIAPENWPPQKETSIPTIHFQGLC